MDTSEGFKNDASPCSGCDEPDSRAPPTCNRAMDSVGCIQFAAAGDLCVNFYGHDELQQQAMNRMMSPSYSCTTNVLPEVDLVERVEAMVAMALLHQEEIWGLLNGGTASSAADVSSSSMSASSSSSDPNLAAIKRRLEHAMDWCRLAQCRLQGFIAEHPSPRRTLLPK